MKNVAKFLSLSFIAAFAFSFFCFGASKAVADDQTDRAEYQQSINKQIQDLKDRIKDVRDDYRKEGDRVNQKIKSYENRIAEIKKDADDRINSKDNSPSAWDKYRDDMNNRMIKLKKDFSEWRLKRLIDGYSDKIDDLKNKSAHEQNSDKKRDLDEKIEKLEAKLNAAKAKLNDLRTTNGDNWDKINQDLDASLKDIDHDYEEARLD